MSLNILEIATKQDLEQLQLALTQIFSKVVEPELDKLNDRYLTVKEIAEFTKHSEATVRKWMTEGKKDRFGHPVKLPYAEFSIGDFRALRSEVIRYGTLKDIDPAVRHAKTA